MRIQPNKRQSLFYYILVHVHLHVSINIDICLIYLASIIIYYIVNNAVLEIKLNKINTNILFDFFFFNI